MVLWFSSQRPRTIQIPIRYTAQVYFCPGWGGGGVTNVFPGGLDTVSGFPRIGNVERLTRWSQANPITQVKKTATQENQDREKTYVATYSIAAEAEPQTTNTETKAISVMSCHVRSTAPFFFAAPAPA